MGESLLALMRESVQRAIAPLQERMAILEQQRALPGPPGQPGQPGAPGAPGTSGTDGRDGRDALAVSVYPDIEPGRSYARGSFARCRNGLLTALRDTEAFDHRTNDFQRRSFDELGWMVVIDGVHEEEVEAEDDGRFIIRTATYASGKKTVQRLQTRSPLYRGVWKARDYLPGDLVTADGSVWHTDVPISAEDIAPALPGCKWKLAVRKGMNGRSISVLEGGGRR
jgi:hypothetical protein